LQNIRPGQPYYLQAHTRLAEINLNYRKDRQAFAKCFRYEEFNLHLFYIILLIFIFIKYKIKYVYEEME